MRGSWGGTFFKNNNPVILELGWGKGEYTVGLDELYTDKNFIGVDIKGSRMWTGATESKEKGLSNVAFLRTGINAIHHFFTEDEVSELWITFADPQMRKTNKRLTSTYFLGLYQKILKEGGLVHLKSDSNFLFTYTDALIKANNLSVNVRTENLYQEIENDPILEIKTYYERQWLARGIDIRYLQFQLPKGVALIEPEIEIPLDEYRSFGRQKRSELDLTT